MVGDACQQESYCYSEDNPRCIVNTKSFRANRLFRPAVGAALAVVCGLFLWRAKPGEAWEHASYDYLFRFGGRALTNKIVLVLMDNSARLELLKPGAEWDRSLH